MAEARILYIATANGLYQLANPGKSDRWREVGRALEGQDVRAVAASPSDPLLVFAGSSRGIFRSPNGGMTWEQVYTGPIGVLTFDQAGVAYAGSADENGELLRSANGVAWTGTGLAVGPYRQIVALPNARIAAIAAGGVVYEYVGALSQWEERDVGVSQVRALVASRVEPNRLFIVDDTSLHTPVGKYSLPAPPTDALVVLGGKNEVLLIGTQGPLLRSGDNGSTIEFVSNMVNVTTLVTPPRYIDQVFAGTADGTLWFSADRGRSWVELRADYSLVRDIAFARAL